MNLITNLKKIQQAVETANEEALNLAMDDFSDALERNSTLRSNDIDEPVLALLNSSFFRLENAEIEKMAAIYSRRGSSTMLRALNDYALANGLSWRAQTSAEKMQIIRQAVENAQVDGANAEKILQDSYNELEGIETRWF